MPQSPAPPCRHPGCPNLTPCPRHPDRPPLDLRPSPARRGYDRAWRDLREEVLRGEPWCRHCADRGVITAASPVHHEIPLAAGGGNDLGRLEEVETAIGRYGRWVGGNLTPLCARCHAVEEGRRRRD